MAMNRKRNRPEDWEEIEPSSVVHIRDLPEHTLEIDLQRTFDVFGRIRDVTMVPNKCQALIEFVDISSAEKAVLKSAEGLLAVSGRHVKVNYSTSKRIIQRTSSATSHEANGTSVSAENNILLLTIYNAQYPINVDIINQITSRHGRVLRIVIFRKVGVQAMVEFQTVQEAKLAKGHLNGADIYSGCCTLKVEFARPTRLSVSKNDRDTWDFESPDLSSNHTSNADVRHQNNSLLGGYPNMDTNRTPAPNLFNVPRGPMGISSQNMQLPMNMEQSGTSVVMIRPSKQQILLEVFQPGSLSDGTPSFKDYTSSRDNRYTNPALAGKNRIFPPSKTLHFWNCPPNFSMPDITQLFMDNGASPPEQFLAFGKDGDKTSSGLVEWSKRSDAIEGLALCNHISISNPDGRYPFVAKLSFSNSPIKERNNATDRMVNTVSSRAMSGGLMSNQHSATVVELR